MADKKNIQDILVKQREYFESGETRCVKFRKDALLKLRASMKKYEDKLNEAVKADLGKGVFESYMCEEGLVYEEISYMLKHVAKFAKPKTVATPLAQFAAKSFVIAEPYGNVLIMSPWNYPVLLTLGPLVDAIAAGNTCVVKPSAYSPETSRVMKELLEEIYEPKYVAVIEGGRAENAALLDERFDYIFFTGGKTVGRLVMEKASKHLTPVSLELGGKSPCIVDETANLKLAAKRLVFGKYLNLGQTCVAPDYLLVQSSVKDKFLACVVKEIEKQFGKEPLKNENYGCIITEKHFERIQGLYKGEHIVVGGEVDDKRRIAPTVIDNITLESKVMQEEIFGPVLPVLTFEKLSEVLPIIKENATPLALYVFTSSKANEKFILDNVRFGGGCVNDTIIHLASTAMGFGGVGESGMGSYHGKCGFDTFTHYKSIVDKKTWMDLPMRYQPYTKGNLGLLKMFIK